MSHNVFKIMFSDWSDKVSQKIVKTVQMIHTQFKARISNIVVLKTFLYTIGFFSGMLTSAI